MKMADGHPLHNLTMPFIAVQCFLFIVSFAVVGERELSKFISCLPAASFSVLWTCS